MAESGSKLIHQMTFALMRVSVSRFTKCHAPKVTSCLAVPAFSLHSPHYPGQAELFAFLNLFLASFRPLSLSLCQSVCLSSLAQLWRQSRLPSPTPSPLFLLRFSFRHASKIVSKFVYNNCKKKTKMKKRSCRTFWSAISASGNGRHVQRQRRRQLPKAGNTFFFVSSPFSALTAGCAFLCGCSCCGQSLCVFLCVCE